MEGDKLKHILRKKTKKIVKLAEGIAPDFDEERIHDFRTQVKRLRSLLRLINTGKDKPKVKIPKKFKRLYHIAGAIRDAQQEIKKLVEWEVRLPVYSGNLAGIIERQKEEWEKHYSKKALHRFEENIAGHNFQTLHLDVLDELFRSRLAGINKLAGKRSPSNDQVHSIRKQVKDMLYNSEFAGKKWEKAYNAIQKLPLRELSKLSDTIGDYNDVRIMLDHITSFSSPDMPKEERETLARLIADKGSLQRKEKKRALGEVKKFTGSVAEK